MVDFQVTSCSNVLCLSQPGGGSACPSLATDRALPAGADVFFAGAAGKNGTGSGPEKMGFHLEKLGFKPARNGIASKVDQSRAFSPSNTWVFHRQRLFKMKFTFRAVASYPITSAG